MKVGCTIASCQSSVRRSKILSRSNSNRKKKNKTSVLKTLIAFLLRILSHSFENHMEIHNIATFFGPWFVNLLCFGCLTNSINWMFNHYALVFCSQRKYLPWKWQNKSLLSTRSWRYLFKISWLYLGYWEKKKEKIHNFLFHWKQIPNFLFHWKQHQKKNIRKGEPPGSNSNQVDDEELEELKKMMSNSTDLSDDKIEKYAKLLRGNDIDSKLVSELNLDLRNSPKSKKENLIVLTDFFCFSNL